MGWLVENISKTFSEKKAVDNISFKIDKPGLFALLGTNGAGKTTTIRMMLGIIKKDSGKITWNGKEVDRKYVNFGYLPEENENTTLKNICTLMFIAVSFVVAKIL